MALLLLPQRRPVVPNELGTAVSTPKQIAGVDQAHASAIEVLDGYVAAIASDAQRYRHKFGHNMDTSKAHNDLTRILINDLPPNMRAALLSEAILRLSKPQKPVKRRR